MQNKLIFILRVGAAAFPGRINHLPLALSSPCVFILANHSSFLFGELKYMLQFPKTQAFCLKYFSI